MSDPRANATASAARIVVGLDGSPSSLAALRWALRQARLTGCTVDAVHVWTPSVSPFNNLVYAQAGFRSEREAADEVVRSAVADTRDADPNAEVPVRAQPVAGHPAAVLRDTARGARILVLGASGHHILTGLLRQEVTHALLKDAPCRVVVIATDGSVTCDSAMPSTRS